ncbi:hypothetical protein ABWH92_12355 [Ahrensia marina]|uniref:hypothetical protein n=1 Tax=Ahrensia marina TaxID=1514904 RepID=UPI0035CFD57D
MKLSNVQRDAQLAEDGQWIEGLPNCEDLRLKVRGMNTTAFADAHARRLRDVPVHKRDAEGNLSAADSYVALGHALADVVLLGWDNIEDNEDGKPIPYDQDTARAWLTNLNTAEFQTAVTTAAARVDLASRKTDSTGEAAKN